MKIKRITRLLKLLQMLQSGTAQNAEGLATACEVARRTLFRDLEALRLAGVPLKFDRDTQRYSIPSSFFLPPTNLTATEALSLIALAAEMDRNKQLPFYEDAYSAALKLQGSLPASLHDELRLINRAIKIRLGQRGEDANKRDIYQQLVDAILTKRTARIEYDSYTEWDRIATNIRPYQLLFSRHSWYVIGRSSMHGEVRTFRLARIVSVEVLNQTYVIPRGFSLERYLGNAWHLIPEPGKNYHVFVRFKPLVAGNVADVVWHKTQQTTRLADGSLEFRATVSGLNEIVWWVLGYGDQAEVIQPAKLRRLVAQRATSMVTMYNGEY